MPLHSVTEDDPLSCFCIDLALSQERLGPRRPRVYGQETTQALTVLARRYDLSARSKRIRANPVWVDADGAERATVMQEAITIWVQGGVPPSLREQRLLALDYEAVMEGVDVRALNAWNSAIQARYPSVYRSAGRERDPELTVTFQRHMQEHADWLQRNIAYQRLVAMMRALRDAGDAGTRAVLYVDHIHRLLGGDGARYPFDLTAVLKPLLHCRQLQLWGACTLFEYRATIEHDASMHACFEAVRLPSSVTG